MFVFANYILCIQFLLSSLEIGSWTNNSICDGDVVFPLIGGAEGLAECVLTGIVPITIALSRKSRHQTLSIFNCKNTHKVPKVDLHIYWKIKNTEVFQIRFNNYFFSRFSIYKYTCTWYKPKETKQPNLKFSIKFWTDSQFHNRCSTVSLPFDIICLFIISFQSSFSAIGIIWLIDLVRFMVFYATISVISCWSVLLVEETRVSWRKPTCCRSLTNFIT